MKRQGLAQKVEVLGKTVFTIADLRKLFPDDAYVKVSIKRMLDRGEIIQVVRGVYALRQEQLDIEKIATQLYYPSYISFESALAKYGVINQGPVGLTLATTRHSKRLTIARVECNYAQLKPNLYFGFELINGAYIAGAEKAILDELYLLCRRKRVVDTSEWNLDDLDRAKIQEYLKHYGTIVKGKVAEMGLDRPG